MSITDITDNDIVFECPHCTKSLAIDARGAGFTIECPDCKGRVKVPKKSGDTVVIPEETGSPQEMAQALYDSNERIKHLTGTLNEVYDRRKYLEKARTDNLDRFDLIRKEIGLIQSAIDRLCDVLAQIEK